MRATGFYSTETCYAFADWLQRTRRRASLSLRRLGQLADLNYSYLFRLEHAQHVLPSRSTVVRIAGALNAAVDEALAAAGYAPTGGKAGPTDQAMRDLDGVAEEGNL